MVQQSSATAELQLKTGDVVWVQILEEAGNVAKSEPALASLVFATIQSHHRLEGAICHSVAQKLSYGDVDVGLLRGTFEEAMRSDKELGQTIRSDLIAIFDRDPACHRLVEPLLYFKGFHALQTYRFSHTLWHQERKDFALYLQSLCSRTFGVDIHPAAQIGRGIMFDHATGLVIGETAKIGDNSSILHGVTLGGSGTESGDRHPKIGKSVLIGAGAKILGNIKIGDCARVAAGSVVVKDVPAETTVAGVPAKIIGSAGCQEPARSMDQMLTFSGEAYGPLLKE